MSPIPNSGQSRIYSLLESDNAQKKTTFYSLFSLRPLKPSHKSLLIPPDVCCCQISHRDNAFRHHSRDRNMICETAMSHHLT